MSGSALPRVLIIMPHLGDGGGERLMLDLLVELRRQGLPVEMLVMQRRGSRVREAAERGVDVDYGCGARQGVVLHGPHIFLKALMAAKRSDLVVAGTDGPATGLALLAARLTRRPCIAMVQANFLATRALDGRPAPVKWVMNRVSLTSRADMAVAVSEEVTHVPTELGMAPGRVRVIYNGVDVARICELAAATPASDAGKRHTGPTLLGVGRLSREKGFDLLVEAHAVARRHSDHRLLLVGDGPERGELAVLAKRLGVSDSVEFLGFLPNPYPVIAAADLVCSPSRRDALSLFLLEAMLLNKPLIATDCPGATRTALDGGRLGDLVPTEDVDALANAFVAHFENPARLQEKAAGGEAWVRERFSIERAAREYIALFQEVARSGGVRRRRRGSG